MSDLGTGRYASADLYPVVTPMAPGPRVTVRVEPSGSVRLKCTAYCHTVQDIPREAREMGRLLRGIAR